MSLFVGKNLIRQFGRLLKGNKNINYRYQNLQAICSINFAKCYKIANIKERNLIFMNPAQDQIHTSLNKINKNYQLNASNSLFNQTFPSKCGRISIQQNQGCKEMLKNNNHQFSSQQKNKKADPFGIDIDQIIRHRNALAEISKIFTPVTSARFINENYIQINTTQDNVTCNTTHNMSNLYDISQIVNKNYQTEHILKRVNKFPFIQDNIQMSTVSPDGFKEAKLLLQKQKNKTDSNILEIYSSDGLMDSICLDEFHGRVLSNDNVGIGFQWNKDSTAFLYLAASKDNSASFKSVFSQESFEEKDQAKTMANFQKNQFTQDYGENYDGITDIQLFMYDITGKKLHRICMPDPGTGSDLAVTYPQFMKIQDSMILFQAVISDKSFKKAFFACTNRKSQIFLMDLQKNKPMQIYPREDNKDYIQQQQTKIKMSDLIPVSKEETAFRPLLSPDGNRILYFGGPLRPAHANAMSINIISISDQLINQIRNQLNNEINDQLNNQINKQLNNEINDQIALPIYQYIDTDKQFAGCYGEYGSMDSSKWLSDSKHVIFTADYKSSTDVFILNTETKECQRLINNPNHASMMLHMMEILDVNPVNDDILLSVNQISSFPKLALVQNVNLADKNKSLSAITCDVRYTELSYKEMPSKYEEYFKSFQTSGAFKQIQIDVQSETSQTIGYLFKIDGYGQNHPIYIELFGNASDSEQAELPIIMKDSEKPLVVSLHGGPHSNIRNLNLLRFTMLMKGYNILCPVFSGSTGFGQKFLENTLGKPSVTVTECFAQIDSVIKAGLCDEKKIIPLGGSFGGFISAHLACQHSKTFTAAIAINPVLNISNQFYTSDIPEWCLAEGCGQSQLKFNIGVQEYKQMLEESPIHYLQNLSIPILILIGKQDRRVPIAGAMQFYFQAKQNDKDVMIYQYQEANHSVSDSLDTVFDYYLKIITFLDKHFEVK